jgi:hypothetical protein
LLVLNDDIRTHSSGTMIRTVHTLRTTWETAVTVFCPPVPGDFCPRVPEAGGAVVVIA